MIIALAALPLLLFFGIILIAHRGVLIAALFSLSATLFIGTAVWDVSAAHMAASGARGVLIATEIILIIFGALLMLAALKKKDSLLFLKHLFESVSHDRRVHVIFIGWGLVYFLEGVAGFGTPAVIAIPLFLALGFSPVAAVVLSLIGDSVPVIFGAIGLPVTLGILAPLSGITTDASLAERLPVFIAGLNFIGSLIVPIMLLFVFSRIEKKPIAHFIEFIPFAATVGFISAIVAFITAHLVGPELPSVIGGIAAIVATTVMAKYRMLIPRTEVAETMMPAFHLPNRRSNTLRAVLPYVLLLALLIISRLPFLPVRGRLQELFPVDSLSVFGVPVDYAFYPFYSAGVLMLISALAALLILRLNAREAGEAFREVVKKVTMPFFALATILAFVQIFISSGVNASDLPSMLLVLADAATVLFGPVWPLIAPVVGALGSFTAGSATVSNIIFSGFQYQTALAAGFDPVLILSLQGIGAAAGNMIALHNVIAALAVAGLAGEERSVIRRNLPAARVLFDKYGNGGFRTVTFVVAGSYRACVSCAEVTATFCCGLHYRRVDSA
jgi:lactate permease